MHYSLGYEKGQQQHNYNHHMSYEDYFFFAPSFPSFAEVESTSFPFQPHNRHLSKKVEIQNRICFHALKRTLLSM